MKHFFLTVQLLLLAVAAYQVTGIGYRQLFPPDLPGQKAVGIPDLEAGDPAVSDPTEPSKDYRRITEKTCFMYSPIPGTMG